MCSKVFEHKLRLSAYLNSKHDKKNYGIKSFYIDILKIKFNNLICLQKMF